MEAYCRGIKPELDPESPMGLDVPMFGMDPDVVEATGAEAASKVIDEVIVAKAAAGEDEHADDADPFPPELGNLKSIGTSELLESLESEPQRLQSLE